MQLAASASSDGRMLFANMTWVPNFWSVPLNANQGTASGEPEAITREALTKYWPSISRDGASLAYLAIAGIRPPRIEVRLRDVASGREAVFPTSGSTADVYPRLSPDGRVVVYRDASGGKSISYVVSSEGGSPRSICENCAVWNFFSDPNQVCASYTPKKLVRQNLATGEQAGLLEVSAGEIVDASPSWDDRWLAVLVGRPNGNAAIFIASLAKTPAPESEWVAVAEDPRYLGRPRWSPDGNLLYYLSQRDDHVCVWAQRLDPATKKPAGRPFAIQHLHRMARAMYGPMAYRSLEIAQGKMVVSLAETTGNIWMTKLNP